MAQYGFGSGMIWATPQSDAAGNTLSNPSPLLVGVLQDGSVDFSFDTKTLFGQNMFPVAAGRGKGKITGKAKFAQIHGAMFNSLIFGQTLTAGLVSAKYDTVGSAIPATPFQVTVTPPNSGTYSKNLGVIDSNGRPLACVAASPAVGQYSVSAGVYTFASADTGKTVYINYEYTVASATLPNSTTSTVMNMPMGSAPSFAVDLLVPYDGKSLKLTLHKCIASKLSMATKQDDFLIPEFDWECFADPVGRVFTYSMSE